MPCGREKGEDKDAGMAEPVIWPEYEKLVRKSGGGELKRLERFAFMKGQRRLMRSFRRGKSGSMGI